MTKERGTLTIREIEGLCTVSTAAGYEEPSSQLNNTLFYTLSDPRVLKRLDDEFRGTFKNENGNDTTFATFEKLPCLNAVLEEYMRIRAAESAHFMRRVTREQVLDGHVAPPKASYYPQIQYFESAMGYHQTVMTVFKLNEKPLMPICDRPPSTHRYTAPGIPPSSSPTLQHSSPERYLSDRPSKLANDQKEPLDTFHSGPGGCLGEKEVPFGC